MLRFGAALLVILLYVGSIQTKENIIMRPGECIRDYTFIFFDDINQYFMANHDSAWWFIVLNSLCMDVMQLSGLFIWN